MVPNHPAYLPTFIYRRIEREGGGEARGNSAHASMTPLPTGVRGSKPSSAAARAVNPSPTGFPEVNTFVPSAANSFFTNASSPICDMNARSQPFPGTYVHLHVSEQRERVREPVARYVRKSGRSKNWQRSKRSGAMRCFSQSIFGISISS